MPPAKKAPVKAVPAAAPVKASARALSAFDEKFGKRFGETAIRKKRGYKVVSTGSLTLDMAMGCGGYIVGRICEIWGSEGAHKTTLAIEAARNFQKAFSDRIVGWIDMERTFDWDWAELHGLDPNRIRVIIPHDSEEVSDMARAMIETGLFSLVVLDSVGGMVTSEEMKNDAEKASVGTAAKVITRMVKQAAVLCDSTDTSMIVINQVRANLSYGGDTTTGGGFALKHVSTHRIKLRRTSTDPYTIGTGSNQEVVGYEVAATVEKNKVAPPRRVATFAMFNQETKEFGPVGIDRAREAFTVGSRLGVIENTAKGYYLLPGDDKPTHGESNTIARLRKNPKILEQVRKDMLARIADQVADEIPEDTPEDGSLDFSAVDEDAVDQKLIDQLRADAAAKVGA